MRRFAAGSAGRKGRPVASLLLAWVTIVALVIYQMPAFTGTVQAMPMPASAAVSDAMDPCDETNPATDASMAGTTAMPHAGMPCCGTSSPDSKKGNDHACPLMGGCFSMCVSITPMAAGVQVTERVAEHLCFVDDVGIPFAMPPPHRPPLPL
jgi:hypothetical protein